MIECFLHTSEELRDKFETLIKGKPENEHLRIAKKLAMEEHEALHKENEAFKKKVFGNKYPIKPYQSQPDKTADIEKVKSEYQTKIDEAKTTKVPDTKEKASPTTESVSKVVEPTGEAKKDIGTKARELAAKLESGEKSVLPSWMKAKLPPGTKYSGIDIDKAYANALRAFAEIHDKTKDFAKAIEEGFKHIKEWFKENGIPVDEAEMKGYFEKEVREKEPQRTAESSGDKFKEKGILNRLHDAENVPEVSKRGFEQQGLKYEPQTHQETEQIGKAMVDQYGIDDAITLAETNKFKGGVNSAIFAESLTRIYKEEQAAKTPEAKLEAAKHFAEVGIRYDEFARGQGRDISQIGHFYKKSPLGVKLMEEARKREAFDEFSKKKEQSWKEFFNDMTKDPEFEKEFKGRVQEELKKERAEARKKRIDKVDKIFDDAINKLKSGGAAYSTFIPIPPKVLAGALEGMKKAYHIGEKVATLVEDAIAHISKEVGSGWDKEAFRKEWENKLGEKEIEPNYEKSYKTRLKNQITDLDEQILNRKRKVKEKKEPNYDDETKDLIKERDEKKKILNEITSEKTNKYLDKLRNKLKGLSESEKDEVIRRAFKKSIEEGALEYPDLRKIIGDVLGYGEMTPEQAKKLVDLVEDINKVEEMATNLRDNQRSEKALNEYLAAKKKAEKSATELGKIVYNRVDIVRRFLSIMQLNTLGIPSLIANITFNIANQLTTRLPRSLIMTAMDFAAKTGAKPLGGSIEIQNNIIAAQKEYYRKLRTGAKLAGEQFITGLTNKDYFQKEIYTSQIHPATSMKEIWKFARSSDIANKIAQKFGGKEKERTERFTPKQLADKSIQATLGAPAEVIARLLNIGDKPFRFASEGAQAAVFAEKLGLKDIDYKLFMEFPKEEAFRKLKKDGLSDEAAMKKAEEIQQRIIREGEEGVFQQDNLLNDVINAAFDAAKKKGEVAYGFGQVIKTLNMPYIKIPLNNFWTLYNLANPQVALLQSMVYGAKAIKTKSAFDIQQSKKWFAHAVVGLGWMAVTGYLAKKGIMNPGNADDTTKKERQGEQNFEQQNSINVSKLIAVTQGKDPDEVKGGLLVDQKWFGNFGILMGYQAQKFENMTPEQKEAGTTLMEDLSSNMSESALDFMDKGVFSGTGDMINSLRTGRWDAYTMNLINMGTNIVQPAAFAQISRAQLPYYSKIKADSFSKELENNLLQRSLILRKLNDKYPPSKISIWGDQLNKKDDTIMRLFGISRSNDDNFAQPLYKDYKRTNDTRFFPPSIKPSIKEGGKTVELNAQETAELEILVGNSRKQLVAPYVNDMARFVGSDKAYSELSDTEKINNLEILYQTGYEAGEAQFLALPQNKKYKAAEKTEEQIEKEKEMEFNNKQLRAESKEKVGLTE